MSAVVFVEFVVQSLEADAEDPGCPGFVTSGPLERSKNELAFGVLDGCPDRKHEIGLGRLCDRLGGHAERRWEVLGAYHIPRADDDGPLDHVPELAHVPGPPSPPENVQRALVDAPDAAAVTLVELIDERLGELGQVIQPVPKWRQLDRENVQPIIEVFAEGAVL